MVWKGLNRPNHVDWFLRSIEANKKHTDLLFVAIQDIHNNNRCVDLGPVGDNIKFMCVDWTDYHAWHADYLCGAWGCDQEQFDAVLDEIVARSPQDIISSFYRIFRGPIFSRFFLSQTRYWGWCDADTIMGSFERTFPWDIAREMDLDVIQPSHTENGPEILVYLRGHLTVFKNDKKTQTKLLQYPIYKDIDSFLHGEIPMKETEEAQFGTWIFHNSTHLDFLTFDGLAGDVFYKTARIVPDPAIFASPQNPSALLDNSSSQSHYPEGQSTVAWSANPVADYSVHLQLGTYPNVLWFPKYNAVMYLTKYPGHDWRRFLYRKDGALREHVERFVGEEGGEAGREWLYAHWLHMKKQDWFKAIPGDALNTGAVLITKGVEDAAEVWADGKRLYHAWRKDAEHTPRNLEQNALGH
ncbi:hypothetical protein CYLTODRAFT_420947 [Cylindrobasidium torrendii FP15055 ss-10]|uniref:Uncharacterized protein n=1 Tax=Cylindrobasidium torrendii FP15055 ss-10 TaxID=1314674 RepID=A0A0D7BFD8_9AGAR|nr:hypothetical protein CYLTODRAFT_420947 [Cylindrobasidium torrendii FP15055 ss-10]